MRLGRAALLLAALLPRGACAAGYHRVWTATDFIGGAFYAATVYTQASGQPGLTLAHQSSFTAGGAWSKAITDVTRLPQDLGGAAFVAVGDYVYAIGGLYLASTCGSGPCGCSSPTSLQSLVYYAHVSATGFLSPWQLSGYQYGQTAGSSGGIPIQNAKAVAVGNRIYVVGGDTMPPGGIANCTSNQCVLSADLVLSAPVNPMTGDVGPWVHETPLATPMVNGAVVYAAGAIFALGGQGADAHYPRQYVQKAEIMPDGHLQTWSSNWTTITPLPTGQPPFPCNYTGFCDCAHFPTTLCDNTLCEEQGNNPCLGWMYQAGFSTLRTIGFVGGWYGNVIGSEPYYKGTMNGALDDCNDILGGNWSSLAGTDALPNAGIVLVNDQLVLVGGTSSSAGSASPNVVWNQLKFPAGGVFPAVVRDFATCPDGTCVHVVPADGSQLKLGNFGSGNEFPQSAAFLGLVNVRDWLYALAPQNSAGAGSLCQYVYRANLDTTTWFVDAGAVVSPAWDLGALYQLTRLRWTYEQSGTVTAASGPNDFVIFRYRVAGEDGKWSCWTPRIPDVGAVPAAPGVYTYSTDATDLLFREVLAPTPARYVQVMLDLYNDPSDDGVVPGKPTIPVFDGFEIWGDPTTPPPPLRDCLEIYPVPASNAVTLRFNVDPDGAETTVRVYNVAGHLVDKEDFHFATGGILTQSLDTSRYAPGVYLVTFEGTSTGGGDGFVCPGGTPRQPATSSRLTGKFVVRR